MKTILLSLVHLEKLDALLDAATFIAKQNDAHVIGYYPIPAPIIIAFASITGAGGDFPVNDVLTQLYNDKLPEVRKKFADHMSLNDVSFEWRFEKGVEPNLVKGILRNGRETDMIVLGHELPGEKGSGTEVSFIADVVLGAGRPVLVIPLTTRKPFRLDIVSIGWNASRESCRAAFDSVPLIRQAKTVNLVWINPEKTPSKAGKLPGAELAAALSRHGAKVTTKGLSNRSKAQLALINHVKEDNVDLLVMGAYGHSRLREQILGGATEQVLRALPCPVLISN